MFDGTTLQENMTYDPMNRLTRVSNTKGDSTLSVYSYQYDNNGNITSATEQIKEGTPQTSTYTNDKLNRLTGVKRADGTETAYSYDLRGNRLTQKDACDLPDEKATNYRYDLDDHLIRVGNDGASTTIQYLPDGLRYQKSQGSTTTRYGYDHWNRVTSDQQEGGTTSQYIRGDRVLVKKDLTNQKDYYYLYNGHGDVVQMVGTDGSLVNSYQYDEWGNVIQQKETISNEFKYAGELYDAETGLYYLKARYYDPKMGRFLNEDSYEGQIDNPLSMNVYTYVHNNPLIYVDPTGHLITESYKDGELRYLLIDARNHISSKSDEDYQLYKDKVIEIYNQFVGSNRYNYLFDLATGTSSYGNSAGKSDWAIAQLISAYQDYELDEYIATLAMGSVGGKGYSRGKGKGSSQRSINACQCFTAGTKVKTDQGEKDIEDIQVGDQVLSKDEKTGEVEYKVVTATFNHETDDIYKISVGDQVIESTFNHPFYVRGKGWTFVKDLKVGDLLVQSDGNTLKIDSIELLHKKVTVYNMTVDEFHTYFVSDLGIWVHNTGPCGYTSIKGKGFNKSYDNLSKNVQGKADAAFKQFKENPDHPSLNFEYLNGAPNGIKYVSARVDGSYRAYGIIRENGVIEWVGINNHDYKAVIRELNSAY